MTADRKIITDEQWDRLEEGVVYWDELPDAPNPIDDGIYLRLSGVTISGDNIAEALRQENLKLQARIKELEADKSGLFDEMCSLAKVANTTTDELKARIKELEANAPPECFLGDTCPCHWCDNDMEAKQ